MKKTKMCLSQFKKHFCAVRGMLLQWRYDL